MARLVSGSLEVVAAFGFRFDGFAIQRVHLGDLDSRPCIASTACRISILEEPGATTNVYTFMSMSPYDFSLTTGRMMMSCGCFNFSVSPVSAGALVGSNVLGKD